MPMSNKLMPVFVRKAQPDNQALDDRVRVLAKANGGAMINANESDPSGPQLHYAVLSLLTEVTIANEKIKGATINMTEQGSAGIVVSQITPR